MTTTPAATGMQHALRERIAALREADGFRHYERARDWVLEAKDREVSAGVAQPSAYWSEELVELEHLFDASPLVVDKLRHHAYTVTGIRHYDYRTGKAEARRRFAAKLEALVAEAGGDALLVPESRALGGFGHEIDGALYNIDTLKYFEVLIAMERGAILPGFRGPGERRVAWEVGAGWGGFAHAFKTLFPETTYVIVDLPELFLFSATYLPTVFPGARLLFHGERGFDDPEEWRRADFVFIPNTALDDLRPPRLDLTLNMVSFQEMTGGQVESYVRKAHELGSPFLYSLNRERSLYNEELESISAIVERWFWPHRIEMLPVNYLKMLPADASTAKKKPKPGAEDLEYKHLVGTRKALP